VPALRGRVNDYANVIPDAAEQQISRRLELYESSTGHQFAVLIIESLEGDSLEEFSIRTVEAWKLGREKEDDGLLLLVAKNERQVRIETGYGLEGDITDAVAARVIRDVVTPAFKSGDFAAGVDQGLVALMEAASGSTPDLAGAPAPAPARRRGFDFGALLFILFFALPLVSLAGMAGWRRTLGVVAWSAAGGFRGGAGWGRGFGGGGFRGGGGFGGGGGGFGGGGASGSW
jgi:uncharacterized protein